MAVACLGVDNKESKFFTIDKQARILIRPGIISVNKTGGLYQKTNDGWN